MSNEAKNGNFAKPMLGAVLSKSTTINVEILKLEKEVPINEIGDFNDWLIHKGLELGLGKQHEYYDYTDNVKDSIAVTFRVYCT
jgi:hypothetical protein